MIEILFGESEAASMKAANVSKSMLVQMMVQRHALEQEKRKVPEKKDYSWIEGQFNRSSLPWILLDIGDIQKRLLEVIRKNLILSLYNQNQWDGEDNYEFRITGNV